MQCWCLRPHLRHQTLLDWGTHQLAPGAEVIVMGWPAWRAASTPVRHIRSWSPTAGPRRVRGARRKMGKHRARQQHQRREQRALPRHQARQVCTALPGRGPVPFPPQISLGRDVAATGARDDAPQPLPGAVTALGLQFSWLRICRDLFAARDGVRQGRQEYGVSLTIMTDHVAGQRLPG